MTLFAIGLLSGVGIGAVLGLWIASAAWGRHCAERLRQQRAEHKRTIARLAAPGPYQPACLWAHENGRRVRMPSPPLGLN